METTRVRIDKWLWAARFYKTRSLAARACELGRVSSEGQFLKPAREVHVGDMLQIRNDSTSLALETVQRPLADLHQAAAEDRGKVSGGAIG